MNKADTAIESSATPATTRFSFAGGTTIAMNMPYSAMPSALVSTPGKMLPAAAPSVVPSTQPGTAAAIRP